ncbi:MAG: hypothetical protein FJ102_19790 [Deltaproteobacteria bacterium]|nr:hypothetical protein [Deltaproteobacteria bacterium]
MLLLLSGCDLVEALRPAPPVEVVAEAPPPVAEVPVEPAPEPIASADMLPPAAQADLLLLREAAPGCRVEVMRLPDLGTTLLAELPACPESLEFVPGAPRFVAVTGGAVPGYQVPVNGGAASPLPPLPELGSAPAGAEVTARLSVQREGVLLERRALLPAEGDEGNCEGPCMEQVAMGAWRLGAEGWESTTQAVTSSTLSFYTYERGSDGDTQELRWQPGATGADASLIDTLDAVAGGDRIGWITRTAAGATVPRMAWRLVDDGGESNDATYGGPVLVERGGTWAPLATGDGGFTRLFVVQHYLVVDGEPGRVIDLRDGAMLTQLDGTAWPWDARLGRAPGR